MNPDKLDVEKTIAMCVQEEEKIKSEHGGSISYVNKKRITSRITTQKEIPPPLREKDHNRPNSTCLSLDNL